MQSSPSILPLTVRGLKYEAGGTALIKDVSFRLNAGPKTVILGANGAGKSLLLKLCHGLIAPTAGEVVWSSNGGDSPRRHQAMVFQRPVMLRRSVTQNIDHALRIRQIPRAQRRELIADALRRTRLNRHAHRAAKVLSFGEQQRLALARAWALRPQILFLDEPTASLDPSVTLAIEELIEAINGVGTKIVMTTHDLAQAKRLADDVLFLHRGRLLEHSPAEILFSEAKSEVARAFVKGELVW